MQLKSATRGLNKKVASEEGLGDGEGVLGAYRVQVLCKLVDGLHEAEVSTVLDKMVSFERDTVLRKGLLEKRTSRSIR